MDGSSLLHRAISRARRYELIGRLADAWFAGAIVSVSMIVASLGLQSFGYIASVSLPAVLLCGLAASVVRWMFTRSTHPLAVASRLDQANRTNDLLATAWACGERDDPWRDAILAQAEVATARLVYPSPRGRHSLRSHLAIGCALAAATIVVTMVTARRGDLSSNDRRLAAVSTSDPTSRGQVGTAIRKPGEATSDSPRSDARELVESTMNAGDDRPREGDGTPAAGDGRSDSGADATMVSNTPPDRATSIKTGQDEGRGSGREGSGTMGETSNGGTSDTAARNDAAPWMDTSWTASRAAAIESLSSSRLSQEQRVLVRAYFDR